MVYSLIKGYKNFNMRRALMHQEKISLDDLKFNLRDQMATDAGSPDRSVKTSKNTKIKKKDHIQCPHLTENGAELYKLLFDNLE